MVILYKLEWYCDNFDRTKTKLITNKEEALIRYKQLKKALENQATYDSAWMSLQEMKENEDFELVEGEVLHYNDF